MCLFRCPDWLNVLSHSGHLCGFSPLWILLCVTRLPDLLNRLLQTVHSNGFSPEWLCLCTVKLRLLLKQFPDSVHLYLLLWTFICFLKESWVAKRFSHWVHEYTLSTLCVCLCSVKYLFFANCLSHTVHKYGLGLPSCRCSVISLLSASIFTSKVIPVYTQQTCTHSHQTSSYQQWIWQSNLLTSHWSENKARLLTAKNAGASHCHPLLKTSPSIIFGSQKPYAVFLPCFQCFSEKKMLLSSLESLL